MFRTLWTALIAVTWFRSKMADRKSNRLNSAFEVAAKKLGLEPGQKDSPKAWVAYAKKAAPVEALGDRAGEAKATSITRLNSFNRVRNFGSRSFWSFLPYFEVASLGVIGAWMFKHQPEALSTVFNIVHQSLGVAWAAFEGVSGAVTGMEDSTKTTLLDGGLTIGGLTGVFLFARAIWRRMPADDCYGY